MACEKHIDPTQPCVGCLLDENKRLLRDIAVIDAMLNSPPDDDWREATPEEWEVKAHKGFWLYWDNEVAGLGVCDGAQPDILCLRYENGDFARIRVPMNPGRWRPVTCEGRSVPWPKKP